jgi:pSer/pThr/pTyr-binding forkhead associated (FHA) protein
MKPKLLRLGRGAKDKENRLNDIQVNHPSVSRSHLEVFIDPENNVFITDLQTSNGTFVNGNPIVGTFLLKEGDILKLGSAKPIQWKNWLNDDFGDADDQTNPPTVKKTLSDNHERLMMTTAGQQKKQPSRRLMLIGIFFVLLVILGAFAWKFNQTPMQSVNANGEIIYTKFDLESKTYSELQQLIQQKVMVSNLSSGETLVTSDSRKVELKIENNILTGLQLHDGIEEIIILDTISVSKTDKIKDTAKNSVMLNDDADGDGVKDIDDHCVNLSGTSSNGGCPPGYYQFRDYKNGNYEVKVLMGGESILQFRERVTKIPTLNCSNPSTEDEIILFNDVSLNEDNKRFKTLPGGYWILFKCH